MGKQQIVIYLCIFIGLFSYGVQSVVSAKESDQIMQIATVLKGKGIQVQGWSLYAKEITHEVDEELLEEKVEALLNKFPHANVEVEKSGENKKVIVSLATENEEKIILYLMDNSDLYTIYQVSGYQWDEENWTDTKLSINKRIDIIFQHTPQIFSCVQGVTSDIIRNGMFETAEELLSDFQATPVESVEEGTYVSLSAYTNKWKNALPTEENHINIQIALRQDMRNDQIKIIVGTPIITKEY